MSDLRFPIGEFTKPAQIEEHHIREWIETIEAFPAEVERFTNSLGAIEKNWRYRPGGWTIKQVVHHCVDSHMNSLIRFKLTLTEDGPSIRPYFEDRWAELPDALEDDLTDSITLLQGLHRKWGHLLRSLTTEHLARTFFHPENGGHFSLAEAIGVYAWHCRHHLAHIQQALSRQSPIG